MSSPSAAAITRAHDGDNRLLTFLPRMLWPEVYGRRAGGRISGQVRDSGLR